MVEVGDSAPPFELKGVSPRGDIETYTLEELTDGAALVLAVYVYDFSPQCTEQLCEISELEWMTFREDANVVGISGDGPFSHRRFIEQHDIGYPLLCDTGQEVVADYGVRHDEKRGLQEVPERSMFLVGPDRRVRYRWVADSNWDDWEMTPLEDVKERLEDIEV